MMNNVILFMEHWLAIGLFIQLAGALAIHNGYRTWVYLGFYLPLILLLIFNWRSIFTDIKCNSKLYFLLFVFLFYFALTSLWSEHINFEKRIKISLLCFLYIIGVAIISKKEKLIYAVLSSSVICVALIISLFIFKSYVINELPLLSRLSSTGFKNWISLENAQIFGTFFGAFFIIAIMLIRGTTHKLMQKLLVLASLLILSGAFFTYSRTMWVALICVGLFYLLINKQYKSLFYFTLTLFVSISIVLFFYPDIAEKAIYRSGFSYRPQIWLMTLSHIVDNPLFGHGSGSDFKYLVTQTFNNRSSSIIVSHPHNLYLTILYYSGLTGLLLYFFVLMETLIKIKKYKYDYLVWLVAGLLVFSLVEQIAEIANIVIKPNEYYTIIWLPIGILLGRITHEKNKKNRINSTAKGKQ